MMDEEQNSIWSPAWEGSMIAGDGHQSLIDNKTLHHTPAPMAASTVLRKSRKDMMESMEMGSSAGHELFPPMLSASDSDVGRRRILYENCDNDKEKIANKVDSLSKVQNIEAMFSEKSSTRTSSLGIINLDEMSDDFSGGLLQLTTPDERRPSREVVTSDDDDFQGSSDKNLEKLSTIKQFPGSNKNPAPPKPTVISNDRRFRLTLPDESDDSECDATIPNIQLENDHLVELDNDFSDFEFNSTDENQPELTLTDTKKHIFDDRQNSKHVGKHKNHSNGIMNDTPFPVSSELSNTNAGSGVTANTLVETGKHDVLPPHGYYYKDLPASSNRKDSLYFSAPLSHNIEYIADGIRPFSSFDDRASMEFDHLGRQSLPEGIDGDHNLSGFPSRCSILTDRDSLDFVSHVGQARVLVEGREADRIINDGDGGEGNDPDISTYLTASSGCMQNQLQAALSNRPSIQFSEGVPISSEIDTEDEIAAARLEMVLQERQDTPGASEDDRYIQQQQQSRPGLEGGSSDELEVRRHDNLCMRQSAEGEVVVSPVPGDGGGGGDGSSGSERDTPLSIGSQQSRIGGTAPAYHGNLSNVSCNHYGEDNLDAQQRGRPVGEDDMLMNNCKFGRQVRFSVAYEQIERPVIGSSFNEEQPRLALSDGRESVESGSFLDSQFLRHATNADISASTAASARESWQTDQSSFNLANVIGDGVRSQRISNISNGLSPSRPSNMNESSYIFGGATSLGSFGQSIDVDHTATDSGFSVKSSNMFDSTNVTVNATDSITLYGSHQNSSLFSSQPDICKEDDNDNNGGNRRESPVYADGSGEAVTDLAFRTSFPGAPNYHGDLGSDLEGFIQKNLHIPDEDFFGTAEAKNMIAEHQDKFEEDNIFTQEDMVAARSTLASSCSNWSLKTEGTILRPSWMCDESNSNPYMRVSIGSFMGCRTEALGSLDGQGDVTRPDFGQQIITPPSERRTVALYRSSPNNLSDIQENTADTDDVRCAGVGSVVNDDNGDDTLTNITVSSSPKHTGNPRQKLDLNNSTLDETLKYTTEKSSIQFDTTGHSAFVANCERSGTPSEASSSEVDDSAFLCKSGALHRSAIVEFIDSMSTKSKPDHFAQMLIKLSENASKMKRQNAPFTKKDVRDICGKTSSQDSSRLSTINDETAGTAFKARNDINSSKTADSSSSTLHKSGLHDRRPGSPVPNKHELKSRSSFGGRMSSDFGKNYGMPKKNHDKSDDFKSKTSESNQIKSNLPQSSPNRALSKERSANLTSLTKSTKSPGRKYQRKSSVKSPETPHMLTSSDEDIPTVKARPPRRFSGGKSKKSKAIDDTQPLNGINQINELKIRDSENQQNSLSVRRISGLESPVKSLSRIPRMSPTSTKNTGGDQKSSKDQNSLASQSPVSMHGVEASPSKSIYSRDADNFLSPPPNSRISENVGSPHFVNNEKQYPKVGDLDKVPFSSEWKTPRPSATFFRQSKESRNESSDRNKRYDSPDGLSSNSNSALRYDVTSGYQTQSTGISTSATTLQHFQTLETGAATPKQIHRIEEGGGGRGPRLSSTPMGILGKDESTEMPSNITNTTQAGVIYNSGVDSVHNYSPDLSKGTSGLQPAKYGLNKQNSKRREPAAGRSLSMEKDDEYNTQSQASVDIPVSRLQKRLPMFHSEETTTCTDQSTTSDRPNYSEGNFPREKQTVGYNYDSRPPPVPLQTSAPLSNASSVLTNLHLPQPVPTHPPNLPARYDPIYAPSIHNSMPYPIMSTTHAPPFSNSVGYSDVIRSNNFVESAPIREPDWAIRGHVQTMQNPIYHRQPMSHTMQPVYSGHFHHDPTSRLFPGEEAMVPSQIQAPGEVCFKEVCCVGFSAQTTIPLYNPSRQWLQCNLSVVNLNIDGMEQDVQLCPFNVKQKAVIEPKTTDEIRVVFMPQQSGVFVAHVHVSVAPVGGGESVLQKKVPRMLTLQAVSERPNIQVLTEKVMHFGQKQWGSCDQKAVVLVNHGLASVPVRLVIMTKAIWPCFSFEKDVNPHYPEPHRQNLAKSVRNCTLKGRSDVCTTGDPVQVVVYFRAPEKHHEIITPTTPSELVESLLNVELDTPAMPSLLNTICLQASIITPKLHVPSSMQCIQIKGTCKQPGAKVIPFRNAGNVDIHLTLSLSTCKDVFEVQPVKLIIAPGKDGEVGLKFQPLDDVIKRYESTLFANVEPDGPAYELNLQGEASSSSPGDQKQQSDNPVILCDKKFLMWGGLTVGKENTQQKLKLRNTYHSSLKYNLVIEQNYPEFQFIDSSGDSQDNTASKRAIILHPLQDVSIPISFQPSALETFVTKLTIKHEGSMYKYSIPLAGYGGTSNIVVGDEEKGVRRNWIKLGEMVEGANNITRVVIHNVGDRAAYVKALAFSDLQMTMPFTVDRLVIQPPELVLREKESKALLLIFNPSGREESMCLDKQNIVGTIGFFFGDEILRQQFRKSTAKRKKSSSSKSRNSDIDDVDNVIKSVNFDVNFTGEELVKEAGDSFHNIITPEFFYKNMYKVAMRLIGEPPSGKIEDGKNLPEKVDSSFVVSNSKKSFEKESSSLFKWPPTPPVKGTPSLPRPKRHSLSPPDNDNQWSLKPSHLMLTTSKTSSPKKVEIVNHSSENQRYELLLPGTKLEVTCEEGLIAPRSSTLVCVNTNPSLLFRRVPLPWMGEVIVKCAGSQKVLKVQIHDEEESHMSHISQHTLLTSISASPHNPSALSALFENKKSLSNFDVVVTKKEINFSDTQVGYNADSKLEFHNKGLDLLDWYLTPYAQAYLKKKSGSSEIRRLDNDVFKFLQLSGTIESQQQTQVPVMFEPTLRGNYTQFWVLQLQNRAAGSCASTVRIQLTGQGVAKVIRSSPKPDKSAGSFSEKEKENVNASKAIVASPDRLVFPITVTGSTNKLNVIIKNISGENQKIRVIQLSPPFKSVKQKVAINAGHYIRLPIEFIPTSVGKFDAVLVIKPASSNEITVKLYGESTNEIDEI